jgi:hypothetical protein
MYSISSLRKVASYLRPPPTEIKTETRDRYWASGSDRPGAYRSVHLVLSHYLPSLLWYSPLGEYSVCVPFLYRRAVTGPQCFSAYIPQHLRNFYQWFSNWPITVAVQSKAWTVVARSNAGIVGSNRTQGMDVCMCLFCVCIVLCVGSGLATGWSSVHWVLPTV